LTTKSSWILANNWSKINVSDNLIMTTIVLHASTCIRLNIKTLKIKEIKKMKQQNELIHIVITPTGLK